MTTAILSPGPSLAETCPTDDHLDLFDHVIAVNRAIMLRPGIEQRVDWHACGDWDTLYSIRSKPRVGICTQRDVWRITTQGQHAPMYAGLEWQVWEELPVLPGYSMISALALASKLGEKSVLVFGDDKQGTKDWDGTAGRDRRDARWERERELQDRAIDKLKLHVSYVRART